VNGAQALIRTLVAAGVDVCFMNPGTSEMHFVAALDDVPEMRGVLALFEGVATGAADGYGRMAEKPAATLLHLGPGLGNGLANLHNARRADTPIVNIVGDHATYHARHDAPLASDIDTVARNVSSWIRRSTSAETVASDAAAAVAAASGAPGRVATLILPADACWAEGAEPVEPVSPPAPAPIDGDAVATVAAALRSGEPTALLIGGAGCRERALVAASRVAAVTEAGLFCETFPARLERGAGLPELKRLAYLAEAATAQLDGLRHLVLVDTASPASFFAYPDKPSDLVPAGCEVHVLATGADDVPATLEALADAVGAPAEAAVARAADRPELPTGALTARGVGAADGHLLPEGAIVSDESNSSAGPVTKATAGAPRHDWMCLTGGAIGQGLPLAVGAAIACPDRPVLALQADGSAMYTAQAWWTMAREQLDITTLIFDNRSYAVLNMELQRVGATAGGAKAGAMLDLSNPDLDFVALAESMGVPATRAATCEELAEQLAVALATPGPAVIDCLLT
jgi:acetolactate synthase-1/2/3 large subunit